MAKPAEKALNTILAKHPSAQLDLRHERSLQADLGDGSKALVTSIGVMHYQEPEAEDWLPIDTTWNPTTGAWQYEMTTAPYQAYARDTFNAGNLVEYQAKSGEFVTFQPLAVSWRDENDSQEQIATPQSVATVVTDDVLSWPNGYGPGRSMEWRAHPTRLQKILRVETAADLPTPAAYLAGSIELELAFAFTFDASVTAFVDGVAWDRSTKRTTGSAIEFRNVTDEVLWAFTAPRAWDSDGNEATGVLVVYKVGNTLHVATRFPRAFVDAAVFPLFVDPTITQSTVESGDDGVEFLEDSANSAVDYPQGWTWSNFQRFDMGHDPDHALTLTGLRFPGVNLPEASTVNVANFTFTGYESSGGGGTLNLTIDGHKVLDPGQIPQDPNGSPSFNLTSRTPRTTATASWSVATNWVSGGTYESSSFASVVQEFVDLTGWGDSSRTLFFLIIGDDPASLEGRRAHSADSTTTDSAPVLYVEYTQLYEEPAHMLTKLNAAHPDAVEVERTATGVTYQSGSTFIYITSVLAGADDGEIIGTTSYNEYTVVRFGYYVSDSVVFLRWLLGVPPGVTISTANVTLTSAGGGTTGYVAVLIRAEASADATAIASYADYSGRTLSTTSVEWQDVPVVSTGSTWASPDLSALVQETVDRSGWASGNGLQLYILEDTSLDGEYRQAAAYEHTTYAPASLYVEYAEPESLTLTPDATVSASGVVDQAAGTTNLHLAVDEGTGTPDDDTTYLVNSASASGEVVLALSNTPSDFGTANAMNVRVRARRE